MAKTTKGPNLKRRLVLLMVFAGILILVLSLRLAQVMLLLGPDYQQKAEAQWTRRTNLTAQRGRILDRNGLVLAQTGTAYRVLANPPSIAADDRVRIATEVSDILGLDYNYVLERISNTKRQQVQLKRQVESSVIDQLEALQLGSGISYTTDKKRYYPFGQLFTQIIGFSGTDGEGQTGIEAEFDSYLKGEDGLLVTEVDRKNQPLSYGSQQYNAPTDGYDLTLTVDSVTESYLEKYVKQCYETNNALSATGLVMDPATSEILAMTSYPSFDLNNPPRDDVTSLMDMSRNRAVTDTFEPGSIFKIVTLAAALDSGAADLSSSYKCTGSKTFRLEKVRCWKTSGHGTQTLTEAVENSCNCAFMEMAATMGVDTLYDYIYAFGFDESTACGLPSEDSGEVRHRKYIRESDLARISFGQTITCTGIQIANAACAAVNGGLLMQPYIVSGITDADGTVIESKEPTILRRVIKSSTSETVRQILQSVVDNGSGSNGAVQNYSVGGKTGTAQKYEEDGTASRTRLIASFIGFVPTKEPQLLCLVYVDEPRVPVVYGSTVAAPWVGKTLSDLVQYYGILPDTTTTMRTVPNVVGMTGKQAADALEGDGFTVTLTPSEEEAVVTMQVPAGETEAARHSIVILYTSMTTYNDEGVYKEMVTVPNLIDRRRQDAYDALTRLGLKLAFDPTQCTGQIIEQSVPPNEKVEPGTTIYVTFPTPTPSPTPSPTPKPQDTPAP